MANTTRARLSNDARDFQNGRDVSRDQTLLSQSPSSSQLKYIPKFITIIYITRTRPFFEDCKINFHLQRQVIALYLRLTVRHWYDINYSAVLIHNRALIKRLLQLAFKQRNSFPTFCAWTAISVFSFATAHFPLFFSTKLNNNRQVIFVNWESEKT